MSYGPTVCFDSYSISMVHIEVQILNVTITWRQHAIFEMIALQYVPPHDKTNNVGVRPETIQISLDIHPVWAESAVRMKKAWVLIYPLSAWRRLWSDWTDAQADLSLRWAHTHFVCFVTRRFIYPTSLFFSIRNQHEKKKKCHAKFFRHECRVRIYRTVYSVLSTFTK